MIVVVSTLIGGLLALVGAFIGPHFQRRHERWKGEREDREILRQKAEDLFDELDRFVAASQTASVAAIARLQDDAMEPKQIPDLGRARSIAAIYFPTSLALIERFEAESFASLEWVVEETKKSLGAVDGGLDTLKALPMIMAVQHQQRAAKFVSEMRNHLATNVPKLELGSR